MLDTATMAPADRPQRAAGRRPRAAPLPALSVIRSLRSSAVALAVLMLLPAPAADAQQAVRFVTPQVFPTGGVPADIAIDDFNGDTHLDVVVTNYDQATITVLLGDGAGNFETLPDMEAVLSPTQLAVGHFDADPALDLVVSETESDTITFLHGNGDGTFGPPVQQNSGHDSQGLAAAHMNADDKLDLVVTLAGATSMEAFGHVDVLLGNGDGTFVYDMDGGRNLSAGSFGVGVADFDGDTKLDVVATALDDRLFLLRGDGEGAIGRADPFPTGAGPFDLAIGDLTGDRLPDVLTADGDASTVSLLRNDGAGGFAGPVAFPVGAGPRQVHAAHLDAGDTLDALTANSAGDVSVMLGDGAGGFSPARNFAAPQIAYAAAAADVSGDGVADLLAAVQTDGQGAVLLMRGRPGGYEATEALLSGRQIQDVVQADLDGDGLPDLVASSRQFGLVRLAARSAGGFSAPQTLTDRTDVGTLAVADLNADGRVDVLAVSRDNPDVLVLLAQSDGGFAAPAPFEIAGPANSLAVADFDADGHLDIGASSSAPAALSVLFGNGDGTFPPRTVVALGAAPARLASGQFDGVAGADLTVSSLSSNDIALLFGRSDRSFDQSRSIAAGFPVLALHSADFDGDHADDVAAGAARGSITVFYGDGAGVFTPGQEMTLGQIPIDVGARDVTGDGRPDLLVVDQTANALRVAPYNVDRRFGEPVRLSVGMNPVALAAGDFDGDGAYDLVGAGRSAYVLTNANVGAQRGDGNGDGVLSAADLTVTASALAARRISRVEDVERDLPGATAGVDIDGDGAVDARDLGLTLARLFGA